MTNNCTVSVSPGVYKNDKINKKQAGKELCHDLSRLLFLDNYLQIILASASGDVSTDMSKINLNL